MWQIGDIGISLHHPVRADNVWRVQAFQGNILEVYFYWDDVRQFTWPLTQRDPLTARKVTADELAQLGIDPNA
jgi:hypothetical protein